MDTLILNDVLFVSEPYHSGSQPVWSQWCLKHECVFPKAIYCTLLDTDPLILFRFRSFGFCFFYLGKNIKWQHNETWLKEAHRSTNEVVRTPFKKGKFLMVNPGFPWSVAWWQLGKKEVFLKLCVFIRALQSTWEGYLQVWGDLKICTYSRV